MASRSAKKSLKVKKTKEHMYNAKGAPEEGEAMDETAGMKKGGKAKMHMKHHGKHHKHGGKVEGEHEKHRADKKSRGGHAHHKRASGGRTPYTSGSVTSMPSEAGKTESGHEGERPSG